MATDQPGATVLEQWRDLQEGAAPAVLLTYTPDVIAATKSENLVGAAAAVGVNLAPYTPVVVDQRTAKDARILTVDGYAPGAATIHYTYIMKRVDGKWLIWYDTLMESALQGYAALAETAGDTGTPSAAILTNDFRTPSAQAFGSSVATKRATESPK